jgi:hypothetical protein
MERAFEGSAGPLRGLGVLAVQEWAAQCHGADTGLTAPRSTVAGMGSPQGVGGTAPGRDSQACQSSGVALWCQSIKCSYARAGTGAHRSPRARRTSLKEASALERGGPRLRGREPSSEADLARGGV